MKARKQKDGGASPISADAHEIVRLRNELSAERAAHVRTAAALRVSEERLNQIFDGAPTGTLILQFDTSPPTLRTNRAWRDLLGYTDAELLALHALDYIYIDDRPAALHDSHRLFAGEITSYHAERRLQHRDGHVVWTYLCVSLVRTPEGAPSYWISQAQDITPSKQAESALLQKSLDLEAVLTAFPDLFFRFDGEARVLAYHAAPTTPLITAPVNFLNRFVRDTVPAPAAELIHEAVGAVCRERQPRTLEYTLPLDVDWRTYEARIWPFQETEAVAIVRDVTEMRQRQAELAHLLRVATMGEMTATLAHEVHQPLQAIINFARGSIERLQRGTATLDELQQPLQRIASEAMRAGEIVRRMREFLRTRQAKREWTDINQVVQSAIALAEPEAMRIGARLALHLEPTLPQAFVDPIQIEQIVLNLVRNGTEATQAAEPQREVVVSTAANGTTSLTISVHDTGNGFSAALADRIFTPLFTTKPEGLGMGLAISRAIAEAHGGDLRAVSASGQGSTFTLTIPIDPRDPAHN